jgi:hypothetical protein
MDDEWYPLADAPAPTPDAGNFVYVRVTYSGNGSYYSAMSAEQAIEVVPTNQTAPTVTPGQSFMYGVEYAAQATGGGGHDELQFRLAPGSTAASPSVGDDGTITANSSGQVAVQAVWCNAQNYNDAISPITMITVNRRPITVTLAGSRAYNGTTTPTGATASVTAGALVLGDTASYSYGALSGVTPGNYSGLATAAIANTGAPTVRTGSYIFSYAGTFTVTKAPLTIAGANQTRGYGAANPPLTASFTGLASGETGSVVTGLVLSTTATAASPVGSYPIAVTGGTAANYTITLSSAGTLTVAKATPVIWNGSFGPVVAGGSSYTVQAGDLTAVFVNADNSTVTPPSGAVSYFITAFNGVPVTPSVQITAGASLSPAGKYTIVASYAGDANYNATTVAAIFNVVADPNADPDGDGVTNLQEALLGTNASATATSTGSISNYKILRPPQ